MALQPVTIRRIAALGLALGSFMIGSRVLYVFKESQKDSLLLNATISCIGLAIVALSVLYIFKSDKESDRQD